MERVTGFEPADTSLGSWGLTTWRHPHMRFFMIAQLSSCDTHLFVNVKNPQYVVCEEDFANYRRMRMLLFDWLSCTC